MPLPPEGGGAQGCEGSREGGRDSNGKGYPKNTSRVSVILQVLTLLGLELGLAVRVRVRVRLVVE